MCAKNNTKAKKDKENYVSKYFSYAGKYIRENYKFLILFFVGLLVVSVINFFKISTISKHTMHAHYIR